jgi:hypothetical protein
VHDRVEDRMLAKLLGRPPKITIPRFSIRKEAPIALIITEILGESRRGR